MNKKHLVTFSVIFTLLGTTPVHAQEVPADEPASAPVTGYQGMLPYIQENAALRKEAQKKYGPKKTRKKGKKTKATKKTKNKKKNPGKNRVPN